MDFELIIKLIAVMTGGSGIASIYSLISRIINGKQIDKKLNKIYTKQEDQLKKLRADLLEQRKQIDNIVDFNNDAAYILDLKILIMDKFIELKHLDKETVQFLEYIQEGFIKFCENIIITRWNYDYIKLDKAWSLFYEQAKRPISLYKLGIIAKSKEDTKQLQEAFKSEIDEIMLKCYPKNYFGEILSIIKMGNGERKEYFRLTINKMAENLIEDIVITIKRYKAYK